VKKRLWILLVAACGSTAAPTKTPVPPIVATSAKPSSPEAAPSTVEVLVADAPFAQNLIVTDTQLYWTSGDRFETDLWSAPNAPGSVGTRLVDGTVKIDNVIAFRDQLAWTDMETSTSEDVVLLVADREGGTPKRLAKLRGGASALVYDGDLVAGTWDVRHGGGPSATSQIVRVTLAGKTVATTPVPGEVPTLLVAGRDLLVGTTAVLGKLDAARLVELSRMTSQLAFGGASDIAADADAIYFAADRKLWRLPHAGEKPVLLYEPKDKHLVTALAIDDRHAYYVDSSLAGGDVLYRIPLTGGTPEALSTEVSNVMTLAVFGPYLYWSDARANRIVRMRR
jgi:sugar lactone lactonase YvrE